LFFKKINKIDKSLSNLTWKRKKTQIDKFRNEKESIRTSANEIQKITRKYFENLSLVIFLKIIYYSFIHIAHSLFGSFLSAVLLPPDSNLLPTSFPGRTCSAFISNFFEEKT
jgi:hypothetical protein